MGALRQSIYIYVLGIVTSAIAVWILAAIIGTPDATDIIVILIMAIASALLPAYLVISRGWGK